MAFAITHSKLVSGKFSVELFIQKQDIVSRLSNSLHKFGAVEETPSLALCLAIEKLIDGENDE